MKQNSLLKIVLKVLDDHKAADVLTIDLSEKATFADYMVIASGTVQRHLLALADYIEAESKKMGNTYVRIEGRDPNTHWVLVDLGTVIVHLFKPETRQLYDLESMWSITPHQSQSK